MTTPTVTEAGAEVIAMAQDVFARARNAEWPEAGRRDIGNAVLDLAIALRQYHDMRNGIVPAWLPGLTPGPDGFARALRMAADNAWEKAEEVTATMAEHGNEISDEGEAAA